MKIAIAGYGKMGRMIHSLINEGGDAEVVSIIDPYSRCEEVTARQLTKESIASADAVIDFSNAQAVMENIKVYAH